MPQSSQTAALDIVLNTRFLPVATSFVENAATAMGLEKTESLALTLASEEIFSYLCRVLPGEERIAIQCSQGGYCVKTEFSFPRGDFNMRAFNITATVSADKEADLEEMGLLIASRSVDHFHIIEDMGAMRLILVKEKKYPAAKCKEALPAVPLSASHTRTPNDEELKLFARLVRQYYQDGILPMDFNYPGKLLDMFRGGDYHGLLSVDRAGHIGGGILWRWAGSKTMECFGPYLFHQEASLAAELLDGCLKAIAKTGALGLINRLPTDALPLESFERLGELTFFSQDGACRNYPAYYRQMDEDPGLAVWAHRDLEDWLHQNYDRLFFSREIRLVDESGESVHPWSVYSTEFDRFNRMATLRPIRYGKDAAANLAHHLELAQKESFRRVFFELDLGEAWQACFIPALLGSGFRPRLVLPYAGKGDLVVFQWGEA